MFLSEKGKVQKNIYGMDMVYYFCVRNKGETKKMYMYQLMIQKETQDG